MQQYNLNCWQVIRKYFATLGCTTSSWDCVKAYLAPQTLFIVFPNQDTLNMMGTEQMYYLMSNILYEVLVPNESFATSEFKLVFRVDHAQTQLSNATIASLIKSYVVKLDLKGRGVGEETHKTSVAQKTDLIFKEEFSSLDGTQVLNTDSSVANFEFQDFHLLSNTPNNEVGEQYLVINQSENILQSLGVNTSLLSKKKDYVDYKSSSSFSLNSSQTFKLDKNSVDSASAQKDNLEINASTSSNVEKVTNLYCRLNLTKQSKKDSSTNLVQEVTVNNITALIEETVELEQADFKLATSMPGVNTTGTAKIILPTLETQELSTQSATFEVYEEDDFELNYKPETIGVKFANIEERREWIKQQLGSDYDPEMSDIFDAFYDEGENPLNDSFDFEEQASKAIAKFKVARAARGQNTLLDKELLEVKPVPKKRRTTRKAISNKIALPLPLFNSSHEVEESIQASQIDVPSLLSDLIGKPQLLDWDSAVKLKQVLSEYLKGGKVWKNSLGINVELTGAVAKVIEQELQRYITQNPEPNKFLPRFIPQEFFASQEFASMRTESLANFDAGSLKEAVMFNDFTRDGTFFTSDSNVDAYNCVMQLAEQIGSRAVFNSVCVFLEGPPGVGKSALMNQLKTHLEDVGVSEEEIEYYTSFKHTFSNMARDDNLEEISKRLMSRRVNIIDDYQNIPPTVRNFLLQFCEEERSSSSKRLFILVSSKSREVVSKDSSELSRLQHMLKLSIKLPDRELRRKVIQKSIEDNFLFFTREQIETLADITEGSDLRKCRGLVQDLIIGNENLEGLIAKSNSGVFNIKLSASVMLGVIGKILDVPWHAIRAKSRKKDVYRARMIATYILFEFMDFNLTEIGELFGQSHSTAKNTLTNAQKTIAALDVDFLKQLSIVRTKLQDQNFVEQIVTEMRSDRSLIEESRTVSELLERTAESANVVSRMDDITVRSNVYAGIEAELHLNSVPNATKSNLKTLELQSRATSCARKTRSRKSTI